MREKINKFIIIALGILVLAMIAANFYFDGQTKKNKKAVQEAVAVDSEAAEKPAVSLKASDVMSKQSEPQAIREKLDNLAELEAKKQEVAGDSEKKEIEAQQTAIKKEVEDIKSDEKAKSLSTTLFVDYSASSPGNPKTAVSPTPAQSQVSSVIPANTFVDHTASMPGGGGPLVPSEPNSSAVAPIPANSFIDYSASSPNIGM